MKGSYVLHRSTYRGKPGWTIHGGPGTWPVRIFFEHESAARRTIAKMRQPGGYEVQLEDWQP